MVDFLGRYKHIITAIRALSNNLPRRFARPSRIIPGCSGDFGTKEHFCFDRTFNG